MTVGIYGILALTLTRISGASRSGSAKTSAQAVGSLQVVAPLDGAVYRAGVPVPVRAALLEPDFVRVDLLVEGVSMEAQINPEPQAVPWMVEWTWEDTVEGRYLVHLQAGGRDGDLQASEAVTVTVVPTGHLIFASNRSGPYAIFAMQSDGKSVARLTSGPGGARQPDVESGGKLVYVTEPEPGQKVIRQLDKDGQDSELFAGREPAWSDDGQRLAYTSSQEGVSQVSSASIAKGVSSIVTEEQVYAGQGSWAPDGERLAYVAEREGNWDIWVAHLDGSQPRRLTQDPAMDWAPAWSPDGSQIAFVSDRNGRHQIYAMRADGSGVHVLTNMAQGAEAPAWSPDGFWLAFVAYTGAGEGIAAREIHLMQADGRHQVRLTYNLVDDTEPVWRPAP
jgi:dipeptidyl aminopeptidase/acylaminoacyl peptidase